MIVGVPKEIKPDEYRIGLIPVGAEELTQAGHQILIEADAGVGSGIPDELHSKQLIIRQDRPVLLGYFGHRCEN